MTYRKSFVVGDRVEKCKGGYKALGTIIGIGTTKAGAVRYMVEYDAIEGLIHIHSDNDLMLVVMENCRFESFFQLSAHAVETEIKNRQASLGMLDDWANGQD